SVTSIVSPICSMSRHFFFYCCCAPPDLHSFPTRRSSDLLDVVIAGAVTFSRGGVRMLVGWLAAGVRFSIGWVPAFGSLLGTVVGDRKSTRLNSSHVAISYAVFCLKKKKNKKFNTVT